MGTLLQEKAMLVSLSISQWTAKVADKEASDKVEKDFETKGSGKYEKLLMKDYAKKINKIAQEMRMFHYANTLPWSRYGQDLLPSKNYMEYISCIRNLKAKFNDAVEEFLTNYTTELEKEKERQGKLFKLEDYPSANDLRKRYDVRIHIEPVSSSTDFRVDIQNEEVEKIKNQMEEREKERIDTAMKDLWGRLQTTIKHMWSKLVDTNAIFRDSLILNVVELCNMLPKLNVLDDPELTKIIKEVESKLTIHQPEILRDDEAIRKDTAKKAEDILKKMEAYLS